MLLRRAVVAAATAAAAATTTTVHRRQQQRHQSYINARGDRDDIGIGRAAHGGTRCGQIAPTAAPALGSGS